MNPTSTPRRLAGLALAALFTLTMLAGVDMLATKDVAAAQMALGAATHSA